MLSSLPTCHTLHQDSLAHGAADVLLTVPNKAPTKGGHYRFEAVEDQLAEPGAYVLQFQVSPSLPGRPPLQLCVRVLVAAGPPRSFEIKVQAALLQIMLVDPRLSHELMQAHLQAGQVCCGHWVQQQSFDMQLFMHLSMLLA